MLHCGPSYEVDLPPGLRGTACVWCGEPVGGDENAVVVPHAGGDAAAALAWHAACLLRNVCGSVDHQRGDCGCRRLHLASLGGAGGCGGATAGLTVRQEARMAVRLFRRRAAAPLLGLPAHVHPARTAETAELA